MLHILESILDEYEIADFLIDIISKKRWWLLGIVVLVLVLLLPFILQLRFGHLTGRGKQGGYPSGNPPRTLCSIKV